MSRHWMFGLMPEAMAVGFYGILLPLFVIFNLKGSLLDVGLIAGVSGLSVVPSVILFGWLVDRMERCKLFLLLSFLGMATAFFLMPFARNLVELALLVVMRSVFYSANLPARQILVAESESREGWAGGLSRLEFLTGLGEALGLGVGALFGSSFSLPTLFYACALLSFVSVIASASLVQEPGLMIERRLVSIERFSSTLAKASLILSEAGNYAKWNSESDIAGVFSRNLGPLMLGIFAFSLAGSTLFTPLPVYFVGLSYSTALVFSLFFLNSMANTIGYLFVGGVARGGRRILVMASASRAVLAPLLILVTSSLAGIGLAAGILVLAGVIWALFEISSTVLYLELAKLGRAGIYGALLGLGSAFGGVFGGYVSMFYGFQALFLVCSAIYFVALLAFLLQFRR